MKNNKELPMILIVEDDPGFNSLWLRIFDELKTDCLILRDPLEAKALLGHKRFNILISDVVLPHINGYELAKFAKKMHPNMEVVLTTAYSTDLSRFDLKNLKFHLLHKPYCNIDEIKKLISHLIKGEDVFKDASEDSFSENDDYPTVTEWHL